MHVRDGHLLSLSRAIKGGSPQGTKLGNFLFCATVEDVDGDADYSYQPNVTDNRSETDREDDEVAIPVEYRSRREPTINCTMDRINFNLHETASGMRNKKNVIRDSILEESLHLQASQSSNWSMIYIDDLSICLLYTSDAADE